MSTTSSSVAFAAMAVGLSLTFGACASEGGNAAAAASASAPVPSSATAAAPDSAAFDVEAVTSAEWVLESMQGQPILEHRPTLTFPEPGRIAGIASCNNYSGAAEVTADGHLKMAKGSVLTLTRKGCEENIDRQEQLFVGLLSNADKLRLDGSRLIVASGARAKALVFTRKP